MSTIAEFILHFVLGFLWWILLFPVVWLVCAPVILVAATFSKKSYRESVSDQFGRVTDFWSEWGVLVIP